MTSPERQEPASPASASNKELREKVAEAIGKAMPQSIPFADQVMLKLADAAIAAGAGTGLTPEEAGVLYEAATSELSRWGDQSTPNLKLLGQTVEKLRAIAAMRGGDGLDG